MHKPTMVIRTRTTISAQTTTTTGEKKKYTKYITVIPLAMLHKLLLSPGMMTFVSTLPPTSIVGGVDGSGSDTVEVTPM